MYTIERSNSKIRINPATKSQDHYTNKGKKSDRINGNDSNIFLSGVFN